MEMLAEILKNIASPLGWTLIHSLWQAAIVSLGIFLIYRVTERASIRYVAGCVGLFVILIAGISTYVVTVSVPDSTVVQRMSLLIENQHTIPSTEADQGSILQMVVSFLDNNMNSLVVLWICGTAFFSLRLTYAWWFTIKLRKSLRFIDNEWCALLQSISNNLEIHRWVALAESASISTPLVIGYLKPVVVVPVGMLSGLTTDEVESILVHELAHIKRHDFLVNLLQSIVEVVFFFNPFVWLISNQIRKQREYCCDDIAVKYGNPLIYVKALAKIEEARIETSLLVLSLAGNKNQLLERIKRLMEKTINTQTAKYKLVPVVLFVVGLICASWLTIKKPMDKRTGTLTLQDTTIKSSSYSKKSVITKEENGEPREDVIYEYEGDVPVDVLAEISEMPPIPPVALPDIHIPPIPSIDPLTPFGIHGFDTIPGNHPHIDEDYWREFSEQFEERFKEQFSEFYKNNEADFEKMMKDMEEQFSKSFDHKAWEEQLRAMANADQMRNLNIDLNEEAIVAQAHAMAELAQTQALRAQEMSDISQNLQFENQERLRALEDNFKRIEKRMRVFEDVVRQEFIKDGYLSEDEPMKDIHWDRNGDIKVNGKKIKESDKKKYNELHEKYMSEVPDGGNKE
jgi:bla regulator protein blaR1